MPQSCADHPIMIAWLESYELTVTTMTDYSPVRVTKPSRAIKAMA